MTGMLEQRCIQARQRKNHGLKILFSGIVGGVCLLLGSCQSGEGLVAQGNCQQTSRLRTAPELLSSSCLYRDIKSKAISPEFTAFTPNYQLWSDGALKSRWIYLPPDSQIDTSNADRWVFPVGTQVFKEFRHFNPSQQEIWVETRHLQKITPGTGLDSWLLSTYRWNKQQTEAYYLTEGDRQALETSHDIPPEQECSDCHQGNTDLILGFDAIQLSDKQAHHAFGHGPKRGEGEWTLSKLNQTGKLTEEIPLPVLPGSKVTQQALGYLHANCGNCHNPMGYAAEHEADHLRFRHKLAMNTLESTDVYQTAVNKPTENFTAAPYILLGAEDEELAIFKSAVLMRMLSTDENYRMPMMASEQVDYHGVSLIHRWLKSLPTPADADFDFKKASLAAKTPLKHQAYQERSQTLTGKGLQLEVQFFHDNFVPPVMAVYWPEDKSLANQPVMDHQAGYFTEKLILGNKGDTLSLRNSDEVGHTIFVRDKKQDVKWQLSYMPPNSEFEQELFWDNDTFVEMKCRLHLYMSAWVGSISSQYYLTSTFDSNEAYKRLSMQDYPEDFTQVKVWLPKFEPIDTRIEIGEEQSFPLTKGGKIQGKLRIKRFAQ
ncbi:hypothetical protein [Thalassomonas sp. RHCl1]|uniref:cupredoxin domain-containing protein n=1 Tax=Thalassomonas sp. RHCl1 TaxID=2995320 RepID=UPI00248B34CD|nr:hypothetical protein [Thalassomonas sp. RHCl1]